jgi:putative aminopeptidase FrvX
MTETMTMRTQLLKDLLEVQTCSGQEDRMVDFLIRHCQQEGYNAWADLHNNVYVVKGEAEWYPAIGAHIDTVQFINDDVEVREAGPEEGGFDRYVGYVKGTEKRHGIGADCKTGVFVCLELLRQLPAVKTCFFAAEEIGCVGARRAEAAFFADIGYFIEFDCPSKNMMSYTSSGQRMFDNDGPFINAILPVLNAYDVKWQHHPFTDVSVIRPRFNMSCLNMASGYYNWHMATEIAYLPDIQNALEMAVQLIDALGQNYYPFKGDDAAPKVAVTQLAVTRIV